MSLINETFLENNSYPLWYFFNDSLMIIGNSIGVFMAFLFIFTTFLLDHPNYSVSTLIVCNACLAVGLTSIIMLINACYALKNDFRGNGQLDSFCIIRGILLKIFHIYMYTSMCLKAYNRLHCIVYYQNSILISYRCLIFLILFQWFISISSTLLIVFTDGIHYDWNSHMCLIPVRKLFQFSLMMIIYYMSILFISGMYIYILYYVFHLPLIERYRRKHQTALLSRVLVLLLMILIPGLFSTFLLICWIYRGSIPIYSFKIRTFLDTVGYTGSVITIFISHTKVRRQYYSQKPIRRRTIFRKLPIEIIQ